MNKNLKIIAMYFTQLHAIPENDKWWGKGFTDWKNVKKAEPLFDTHYQPRIPSNSDYYDQSRLQTLRQQVELAKKYGIYGFCHYHYWFDGKQLLETPTNLLLDNSDIDFPFCLSWANETWSRRWDGQDHDILIQQTHPPTTESWSKHFDYLIKAWTDDRAIKIDDKPVFIIYRPQKIKQIDNMLEYWNNRAKERGLKGVYFIFQEFAQLTDSKPLKSFDASFKFQPFNALVSETKSMRAQIRPRVHFLPRLHTLVDLLPKNAQRFVRSFRASPQNSYTIHDYDKVWKLVIKQSKKLRANEFPGAFVDFDNTARYGNRSIIIRGATPKKFRGWFSKLADALSNRPDDMNFLFFNAWNEWAEGAYLEPDEQFGTAYLEVIRDTVTESTGNVQ